MTTINTIPWFLNVTFEIAVSVVPTETIVTNSVLTVTMVVPCLPGHQAQRLIPGQQH